MLLATAGLLSVDARSAAAWSFTDVTSEAGVSYQNGYVGTGGPPAYIATGVAAGDYDGDGFIDLYVVRGDIGPNLLFHNRGNGTFEEVGAHAGVALTGAFGSGPVFADFDGDGKLDLLVLGIGIATGRLTHPTLFRNRGDGTFEDVTAASGITTTRDSISAAFGDYNKDGYLDLFLTHWGEDRPPGSTEHLWENNGDGSFTDVSDAAGFTAAYTTPFGTVHDRSFTPNFADINNDGWPDLLISGDFKTSKVFLNNKNGTFTNVTNGVITDENGMGGAVGDYDGDGILDWFVSSIFDPSGVPHVNWGATGNRLYRGHGDGTFEDATDAGGVRDGYWGWGSTFEDLNNDGWLDLFHVNGWQVIGADRYHDDPSRCFVSNGNGTFTQRAEELGVADTGQGRGVVAFDFDRDGDLDLFIANNNGPGRLYRNDGGNAGNWLDVKLRGRSPNTEGIGARVTITAGGRSQLREMRAGSNFESQDPAEAHFGLGAITVVDEVRVAWLDGPTTTMNAVPANQRIVIEEPPALPGTFTMKTTKAACIVSCTLADPSGKQKATCEGVGFGTRANAGQQLTANVKRQFNKRGSARLALKLNHEGKKLLKSSGTLALRLHISMTDRMGHSGQTMAAASFKARGK